jgi:hypothetical protein
MTTRLGTLSNDGVAASPIEPFGFLDGRRR